MGSEHASYASSKPYLTTLLPKGGSNYASAIGDEAASVRVAKVNGEWQVIAFSSESHNGPSYIAPNPGAATGIGGCLRDNIALTGNLPIAIAEARRQSHPIDNPHLDPVRRHSFETTAGVGGYSNAMGIPFMYGSEKFDSRFSGNNLVNVMSISVAPENRLLKNKVPTNEPAENYVGIYIGKASDLTGLGGTKFASTALDSKQTALNEAAVQDQDPHLQEAWTRGIEILINQAIAEGWKDNMSIKDMGAAGLLCSTIEQLHGNIGMILNADLVPMQGERSAMELLEAETQERMFIIVPESKAQAVLDIFNDKIGLEYINEGAKAAVVARMNNSGMYRVTRHGKLEVELPAHQITDAPMKLHAVRPKVREAQVIPLPNSSIDNDIRTVLGSINFKSDAPIHDHYDKHVQGTHIVNPGEGCAPLRSHHSIAGVGISASFDSMCTLGLLDPKLQAEDSLVRGAYRMAAVGASVIGVSNNANYGRVNVPDEMWEFKQGQEGVGNACYNWMLENKYVEMLEEGGVDIQERHLGVGGGNVSLNKANKNTNTAIPPTTILGLVGWTPEPTKYATWDLKAQKSSLYVIGERQAALGGSDYLQTVYGSDMLGDKPFEIDYKKSQGDVTAAINAVRSGLVSAANVIEEGGLANAVAEMVANTQAEISVEGKIDDALKLNSYQGIDKREFLFSESSGLVVQVTEENDLAFRKILAQHGVQAVKVAAVNAGGGYMRLNQEKFGQREISDTYHNKLPSMLERCVA